MQSVFNPLIVAVMIVLCSPPQAAAVTIAFPQHDDVDLQIHPSGSLSLSNDRKLISPHSASVGGEVPSTLIRREPEQQQRGVHSVVLAGLQEIGAEGLAAMPSRAGEEVVAPAAAEPESLGAVPPVPGATATPVVPPPPAVPAVIPNGTVPSVFKPAPMAGATTPPDRQLPAVVGPAAASTPAPPPASPPKPAELPVNSTPPAAKAATPAPNPAPLPVATAPAVATVSSAPTNSTPSVNASKPLVGGPPTPEPLLPLPPVGPVGGVKSTSVTKVSGGQAPLPPLVQKKTPAVTVLLFGISVTIGLATAAALACMLASHNEASKNLAVTGASAAAATAAAAAARDHRAGADTTGSAAVSAAAAASRRSRANAGSGESPAQEVRSFGSKENRW